jgi:hypothetical protein
MIGRCQSAHGAETHRAREKLDTEIRSKWVILNESGLIKRILPYHIS